MLEIILLLFVGYSVYLLSQEGFVKRLFPSKASAISSTVCKPTKLYIPEDSVLKRHFTTHLKSQIESELSPRPTDAVLQRHYDSMITVMVEDRLQKIITV